MMNFSDVPALRDFVRQTYETVGPQGQAELTKLLHQDFGFSQYHAQLYASIVLSRNADSSADCIFANAKRLAGSIWMTGTQSGIPGGWLNTTQETWQFKWNLQFSHERQTYEGYTSPFGASYSRPTRWRENGIWAPSDSEPSKEQLEVLAISLSDNGPSIERLLLTWPDDGEKPIKFSLRGTVFIRQ